MVNLKERLRSVRSSLADLLWGGVASVFDFIENLEYAAEKERILERIHRENPQIARIHIIGYDGSSMLADEVVAHIDEEAGVRDPYITGVRQNIAGLGACRVYYKEE